MFIDTSGLLCYLHRDESHHYEAVRLFNNNNRGFLTHCYILAELVALAQVRRFPRSAVLAFLTDLSENPDISIIWINEQLNRQAINLLHDRPDKTYSLCDAASFVLMRQYGLTDALTTDRHFEQEGFVRLLKPMV